MKELNKIEQDKLQVEAVKPIIKKEQFLGSLKPKKGHSCFEFNLDTLVMQLATFESVTYGLKKNDGLRKKLVVNPSCIYATALNKRNAMRHFLTRIKNLKNN